MEDVGRQRTTKFISHKCVSGKTGRLRTSRSAVQNSSCFLRRFVGVSDRLQQFVKERERNKQLCSSTPQTSDTQPRTASTSAALAAKPNAKSAAKKKQKPKSRSRAKSGKEFDRVAGDEKVTGGQEGLKVAPGSSGQTLGAEEKKGDDEGEDIKNTQKFEVLSVAPEKSKLEI